MEEEDGLTVGGLIFIPVACAFWWHYNQLHEILNEVEDAFGIELGNLEEKIEEIMDYKLFDGFKS